jgi:hypothetical protein
MNHILYKDGILKAKPFKRLPWGLCLIIIGTEGRRKTRHTGVLVYFGARFVGVCGKG